MERSAPRGASVLPRLRTTLDLLRRIEMEPLDPWRFGNSSRRARAFSLLEILAVVAILEILMVLVAPAIVSSLGSSNLNKAGQTIGDQIALARQEALTRNREVQIRFLPRLQRARDRM